MDRVLTIQEKIDRWLTGPFDPAMKEEIRRLQENDPKQLSDAFFKDLSFGTGGMRGIMGVGTNRMNSYTIGVATQGLANYLKKQSGKHHSVFIGYDVRHHSRDFAEEAALILAGNGMKVYLSKDICPTPLTSFACRYLKCSAAIIITASHNPPEYNGYKVYWNDGAQVVPPHDTGIMEEAAKIHTPDQIHRGGKYEEVGSELDDAYLAELKKLQPHPELAGSPLKIIYSNLHGTGIRLVPKALKEWGYSHLSFVEKQKPLDGNFTNAHSPNPEDEKAMKLGMEQLQAQKEGIFIATDPDADRVGVVALHGGKPIRLTGNQTACICLHHICTSRKLPSHSAFIKTIVTTELFKVIAESFKGQCIDVLTGFKYIGEKIEQWEHTPGAPHFLFGAEESYGSLFGTFVRDKDAVSAACLIAEVAALAQKQNLTLIDRLYEIYRTYGVHRESLTNLAFSETQAGMKQMTDLMKQLRAAPPTHIGDQPVVTLEDYLERKSKDIASGKTHPLDLPPSDVLRFWLKDGSKLVIRPSGTEPKVKIYAEVKEKNPNIETAIASCDHRLETLVAGFRREIS